MKIFKFIRLALIPVALGGLFLPSKPNTQLASSISAKAESLNELSLENLPEANLIPEKIEPKAAVKPNAVSDVVTKSAAPKTAGRRIEIPAISINAPIVTVGLEKNRELHVPANSTQAGWYKHSPIPGQIGPSIITAHLDFGANFTPGVFYNLNKIQLGDEIKITNADGSVAVFSVTQTKVVPQNDFPTQLVYGKTPDAQLRLITCAGKYDPKTGRYTHDLVVFAKLKQILAVAH